MDSTSANDTPETQEAPAPPGPNSDALPEWSSNIRAFVSQLVAMQTAYGSIAAEQAKASMALNGISNGFLWWQELIKTILLLAGLLFVGNLVLAWFLFDYIMRLRDIVASLPR